MIWGGTRKHHQHKDVWGGRGKKGTEGWSPIRALHSISRGNYSANRGQMSEGRKTGGVKKGSEGN